MERIIIIIILLILFPNTSIKQVAIQQSTTLYSVVHGQRQICWDLYRSTVDTVMDESDESMEPKTDRVSRNKAIKYGRNWRD